MSDNIFSEKELEMLREADEQIEIQELTRQSRVVQTNAQRKNTSQEKEVVYDEDVSHFPNLLDDLEEDLEDTFGDIHDELEIEDYLNDHVSELGYISDEEDF